MTSIWRASLRICCIVLSCWILPSSFFKVPLQSLKENIIYLLCSYALIFSTEFKKWGPAVIMSMVGALGILFTMILFGATIDKLESAAFASVYISLLVFFPAGLEFGFNTDDWVGMISFSSGSRNDYIKRFHHIFYGTLIVGLLAPIVHPLDWQRDWQKWPIPVVTGAQVGCIMAILVTELT